MKNKFVKNFLPLIILVIIIAGIFIWHDKNTLKLKSPITPAENGGASNNPVSTEIESPKTNTDGGYSYTNDEFHFAVKLPGLTVTKKDQTNAPNTLFHPITFSFGNGTKNTLAVYIWKNKAEFQTLMIGAENQGKVTINGQSFDKYKIIDGDVTVYRYATTLGNITYDVGVYNQDQASNFYIIK